MLVRLATALVSALPLLAAQDCGITAPPPPTREESCVASLTTWAILGLEPVHLPLDEPTAVLKATLHVGDTVGLRISSLDAVGPCDDLVETVQWRSTAPTVATARTAGLLNADLEALGPGETIVSADLTLAGGTRRTAELYGTPTGSSGRLRVFAVRVVR